MSADGGNTKTAETKAPDAAPARPPAPQAKPAAPGRRRYLVMAAVPVLLLAVGAYFWLTSGRYASTDNAYVRQDKVTITSDVSGRIVEVAVGENQHVKQGDLLFRIDPEPYRIALAQAEAATALARLSVDQLRSSYQQALAAEKTATEDVDFSQKAFDRQHDLLKKGFASEASYEQAENNLHTAEQALAQATERAQSALAGLGGDASIKTDDHPTVAAALAKRDQAALDFKHTATTAPIDGVVAQTARLQVGAYVTSPAGNPTALLSIVDTNEIWVEANFKETDLTHMAVGQPARITIDAFPGHSFDATVASIGAGTGSEFSVLPAQNASGNWVKVVQRVPVRLRFSETIGDVPLRTGLSASVAVDTKGDGTEVGASQSPAPKAASVSP
jgi:membrane fusion protein (multidrug efflux system)